MSEKQMRIALDIPKMQKMNIMICTPMYGGMCHGLYTKSLMDTTAVFMNHGIQSQIYYLFNESLITRARNYCVANFLKNDDATHLLFIDSDICWRAMDLMYLLHTMATREDIRVLCGLYPKKTIAWEKVLHVAKQGNPHIEENPELLSKVAGDMVFNPLPDAYPDGKAPVFEPVQIKEGATGFMLIEKSVFKEYAESYPELEYTPDHIREGDFQRDETIHAFFDCIINDQNRYLSEDYMFSEYCNKIGINIWAMPMIELMHCGSYIFQGKLVDMALQGVHATLAPEDAEKILNRSKEQSSEK